mgnify:FL=1
MSYNADIQQTVVSVIAEYLDMSAGDLALDTDLELEYGLDSTEMVCIAVDLEKQLGLSLKNIKFSQLNNA